MTTNRSVLEVIRILLKWRFLIIGVTIVGAIGSVVIALLLPNYYKSTAIFYPQNLSVYDRGYLFGTGGKEKVQNLFGTKSDVNRIIAIAQSSELIGHMIHHFDLAMHYEIDTTGSKWHSKVNREFEGNFEVMKTDLDNVKLSIWDQNPRLAADMVNYMVAKIDAIYSSLVRSRNTQNVEIVDQQVQRIQQQLDSVSAQIANFTDTAPASYEVVTERQKNLLEDLSHWTSLYNQYKAAASFEIHALFMVEQAYPAERKDRPVRWMIVVSATLVAFFFSMLAALILEQYKAIKQAL